VGTRPDIKIEERGKRKEERRKRKDDRFSDNRLPIF